MSSKSGVLAVAFLSIGLGALTSAACRAADVTIPTKVTLRTLTLLQTKLNSDLDSDERRLVAEKIIQAGNDLITTDMSGDNARAIGSAFMNKAELSSSQRSYIAFWLLRGEASVAADDETTGRQSVSILRQLGIDKSDDDRALTLMAAMNQHGWLRTAQSLERRVINSGSPEPVGHLSTNMKTTFDPTRLAKGDYHIGIRVVIPGSAVWGVVVRPGAPWGEGKWVVLNEEWVKAPDRLPEKGGGTDKRGFDNKVIYRMDGHFTGDRIYDICTDSEVSEFRLTRATAIKP